MNIRDRENSEPPGSKLIFLVLCVFVAGSTFFFANRNDDTPTQVQARTKLSIELSSLQRGDIAVLHEPDPQPCVVMGQRSRNGLPYGVELACKLKVGDGPVVIRFEDLTPKTNIQIVRKDDPLYPTEAAQFLKKGS